MGDLRTDTIRELLHANKSISYGASTIYACFKTFCEYKVTMNKIYESLDILIANGEVQRTNRGRYKAIKRDYVNG